MHILLPCLIAALLQLLIAAVANVDSGSSISYSTSTTLAAHISLLKSTARAVEDWESKDIELFTKNAGFSSAFCASINAAKLTGRDLLTLSPETHNATEHDEEMWDDFSAIVLLSFDHLAAGKGAEEVDLWELRRTHGMIFNAGFFCLSISPHMTLGVLRWHAGELMDKIIYGEDEFKEKSPWSMLAFAFFPGVLCVSYLSRFFDTNFWTTLALVITFIGADVEYWTLLSQMCRGNIVSPLKSYFLSSFLCLFIGGLIYAVHTLAFFSSSLLMLPSTDFLFLLYLSFSPLLVLDPIPGYLCDIFRVSRKPKWLFAIGTKVFIINDKEASNIDPLKAGKITKITAETKVSSAFYSVTLDVKNPGGHAITHDVVLEHLSLRYFYVYWRLCVFVTLCLLSLVVNQMQTLEFAKHVINSSDHESKQRSLLFSEGFFVLYLFFSPFSIVERYRKYLFGMWGIYEGQKMVDKVLDKSKRDRVLAELNRVAYASALSSSVRDASGGERGGLWDTRAYTDLYEEFEEEVLGEGGFGKVTPAKDRSGGKDVAIKRITFKHPPKLVDLCKEALESAVKGDHAQAVTASQYALQQFMRNIKLEEQESMKVAIHEVKGLVAARALNNPNLLQLRSAHKTDKEIVICCTMVDRPETIYEESLFTRLAAVQTFFAAIADLHAAGITHRDIKPENLGYTFYHRDQAVVLDFGIVSLPGSDADEFVFCQTHDWLAPESYKYVCSQAEAFDHLLMSSIRVPPSDVFACALTAIQILVKEPHYAVYFNGEKQKLSKNEAHAKWPTELRSWDAGRAQRLVDKVVKQLLTKPKSANQDVFSLVNFSEEENRLPGVVEDFSSLLKEMLNADPAKRMSMREAASHRYFVDNKIGSYAVKVSKEEEDDRPPQVDVAKHQPQVSINYTTSGTAPVVIDSSGATSTDAHIKPWTSTTGAGGGGGGGGQGGVEHGGTVSASSTTERSLQRHKHEVSPLAVLRSLVESASTYFAPSNAAAPSVSLSSDEEKTQELVSQIKAKFASKKMAKGQLDLAGFEQVLDELPLLKKSCTFDPAIIFKLLDLDNSGGIDECELLAGFALLLAPFCDAETRLALVFSAFDENNDNSISLEELTKMMAAFSPLSQTTNLTNNAVALQDLFTRLDTDKSGGLSLKEFQFGLMNNHENEALRTIFLGGETTPQTVPKPILNVGGASSSKKNN